MTFAPPDNCHTAELMLDTHSPVSVLTVYTYYNILKVHSLENLISCFVTFLRKEIPVLFCLNVLVTQDASILSDVCVEKSNTPYVAYSFLRFKLTNY